ncbi:MAG: DNA-binding domain-containing protein [Xenococcaceae cyanobacterium]
MNKSQIAVRVPPLIMKKLNSYVENTGTTKTEVIVGALAKYLDCTQDLSMPKRMAEVERKVAELERFMKAK